MAILVDRSETDFKRANLITKFLILETYFFSNFEVNIQTLGRFIIPFQVKNMS